ncbi:MAG: hypothetical protein Kow0025_13170 [Thermodesulfovibrionales bacterium]
MALKAVIDLAEPAGGRVFLYEKGSGRLVESVPFAFAEGRGLAVEGALPGGIEESALSLPAGMLDFRVLDLSLDDMEKIRQVLPFELEGLILGDPDEFVFDAVSLGEAPEGGRRVLAVYLAKSALRGLLAGLAGAGLDPRAVTSLDLGGALASHGGDADALSGLLLKGRVVEEDYRAEAARRESESPSVNLRRGEFAYAGETERTKKSLRLTAALFAALMLVAAGNFALKAYFTHKDMGRVEGMVLSAYGEIFPGEKPASAAGLSYKVKSKMKEMEGQAAFVSGVSPLEFLLELQRRKVPGLVFTEVTVGPEAVSLKGEAPSLGQVEELKARLAGLLTEVNISDTGRSARDRVLFTITGKGAGG